MNVKCALFALIEEHFGKLPCSHEPSTDMMSFILKIKKKQLSALNFPVDLQCG